MGIIEAGVLSSGSECAERKWGKLVTIVVSRCERWAGWDGERRVRLKLRVELVEVLDVAVVKRIVVVGVENFGA